uniref:Acetyl-CoA acyltransferase 2 n=1 Tax=Myotis myotis TaxID=51298 RepID=A0A7J7VWN9_MYOMY|nr:acetyl-CoA acyltransferase 2 [Myotis myotis]
MALLRGVFIVAAKRTPFGAYGGLLKDFTATDLAVERNLGLDPSKTNINGGAIALGHPLGASGSRITAHLVHELRRRGGKYGVGSACIGGGQGIAVIIESMA